MDLQPFEFMDMTDLYRSIAWVVVPSVLAFAVLVVLRLRRWWRGQINPSDSVRNTVTGNFAGGISPEFSLLAGAGAGAQPNETLGELFLRPTVGLRLITIAIPAFAVYLLVQMQTMHGMTMMRNDLILSGAIVAVMVHVLIYTNVYELRYDRDRFVHKSWFYQRREIAWSDILSIRDDNAYFYEIRTSKIRKTYVPKHLIGIEGFVDTVQTHIVLNESR